VVDRISCLVLGSTDLGNNRQEFCKVLEKDQKVVVGEGYIAGKELCFSKLWKINYVLASEFISWYI
jgi:hypothetical protein